MTWPSGARCAVAFTFDFDAEEVWLAGDPDAASKPGLLSMGAYGANVGVPELLRLLDRRGLPATFFVPGRVAEMHPDRVRDIVAAGPRGRRPRLHAPLADRPLARRGGGRAQ